MKKQVLLLVALAALTFSCSDDNTDDSVPVTGSFNTFEEAFAITPPEWTWGTWVSEDIENYYTLSEDDVVYVSNIPNQDITKMFDETNLQYFKKSFKSGSQYYNKEDIDYSMFYYTNSIDTETYTFSFYSFYSNPVQEFIYTKISDTQISIQKNSRFSNTSGEIVTYNRYE